MKIKTRTRLAAFSLSLLCACGLMTSCEFLKDDSPQLPTTSETFDQVFVDSFYENYDSIDPNLYYYTASPWEIKLDPLSYTMEGDKYFSKIDGVDVAHFVSRTTCKREGGLIGMYYYETRVFQHKDAPVPMEEWTIKSVSLVKYHYDQDRTYIRDDTAHEQGEHVAQNYLDAYSTDSKVYSTYDQTSNPELLIGLQESFQNREKSDLYLLAVDEHAGKSYGDFKLLVQFEENDNLAWVSQLYLDKNGDMYIDCTITEIRPRSESDEENPTFYFEENKMRAKLNDQFAEVIKNRIPDIIKSTLPDNEE